MTVGLGLAASVLVGLVAAAFLWPITTASPQHVPLAIAGPAPAVSVVEDQLAAQDEDLFDLTEVADRDAAVEAIEKREVAGAIVVGPETEILTTSAGNPQVAQMLAKIGEAMEAAQAGQAAPPAGEQSGAEQQPGGQPAGEQPGDQPGAEQQPGAGQQPPTVKVTDVVPAGSVSVAANLTMMPGLIGGMAGAVVSLLVVRTPIRRFATLAAVATAGGLVGAAVLGPWFDVLQGNYWLAAAALGMGILAISSFISGLGTLLGRGGMVLGILTIFFIANPWAGLFAPREFLSEPMGTIGAYMPNGAFVDLLRSISFFPDAPTGGHWLVLAIWAGAGLLMLGIGAALQHRRTARQTV